MTERSDIDWIGLDLDLENGGLDHVMKALQDDPLPNHEGEAQPHMSMNNQPGGSMVEDPLGSDLGSLQDYQAASFPYDILPDAFQPINQINEVRSYSNVSKALILFA